ncbi:MAG TPA: hypothetical protein VHP58_02765 [Alphaproteobacteria bacterium]|nr:hypothetical protein [Alphaproteobacteria bacterium]
MVQFRTAPALLAALALAVLVPATLLLAWLLAGLLLLLAGFLARILIWVVTHVQVSL